MYSATGRYLARLMVVYLRVREIHGRRQHSQPQDRSSVPDTVAIGLRSSFTNKGLRRSTTAQQMMILGQFRLRSMLSKTTQSPPKIDKRDEKRQSLQCLLTLSGRKGGHIDMEDSNQTVPRKQERCSQQGLAALEEIIRHLQLSRVHEKRTV